MYWYRAKTILIIFFVFTNLFLLVNILKTTSQGTVVQEEVVSAALTVLEQNGISIDPELIPRRNRGMAAVTAENIIQEYDAFAEIMLGKPVQKTGENTYTGSAGTITFSANRFSFTAGQPQATELTPAQAAAGFLKARGFDLSGADRELLGNTITYYQKFSGAPLWDAVVNIQTQNGAVLAAEGCWFQETGGSVLREKIRLKNITGVLADYATEVDAPAEIVGLEQGYMLPAGDRHVKKATLVPAWQIQTADAPAVLLDARENSI